MKLRIPGALTIILLISTNLVADQQLHLTIKPQDQTFESAAKKYRAIWDKEGTRIVLAMEEATGLDFESGPISVVVYEGPSYSGFREIPMKLRASYPESTKRATLVHELAHRLISELVPKEFEDHPVIFLFVYDVWVQLWGKQFADEQVAIESQRRGIYDYETAWKNTLKLDVRERRERFKQFLKEHDADR